ncbi:hypothetical protein [Alcanivorax sp.]|jgi:hypothetical protein|uniref:hypothetical protein n=1 Tax=Alcanivorax sp. TaxID=1872427 RepID=UPI0032D8C8A5
MVTTQWQHMKRAAFTFLLLSAATPGFANLSAQGPEYLVNTTSSGYEATPHIAVDGNNQQLIVWTSENRLSSDGPTIKGQFYNPFGESVGPEKTLVSAARNIARIPEQNDYPHIALTMWNDGTFALAWSEIGDPIGDTGNDYNLVIQFFNADGTPADEPATVANTDDKEALPVLAHNDAGLVIAWQTFPTTLNKSINGKELKFRRYNKSGNATNRATSVTPPMQLTNLGAIPAVALNTDNTVFLVWGADMQSKKTGEETSPHFAIRGALFAANDNAIGETSTLYDITDAASYPSDVHATTQGDNHFLAAWDSGDYGNRDPMARSVSLTGELGSVLGQQTQQDNAISAIAKDNNGNAFIVWNRRSYSDTTLYAQQLTINGLIGESQQVSTYTTPEENHVALTVDSNDSVTVSWESWIENDDDAPDIYARRFEVAQNSNAATGGASSGGGGSSGGGSLPLSMLAALVALGRFRRNHWRISDRRSD